MNRIYINTNDGNYYRITVRAEKPCNSIEIAWDGIRNAVTRGIKWIGFSEADGFEIREKTMTTIVPKIMFNLDNISSIEFFEEDKKDE